MKMTITVNCDETLVRFAAEFAAKLNGSPDTASMFCPSKYDDIVSDMQASGNLTVGRDDDRKICAVCWMFYDPERKNADVNLFAGESLAGEIFAAARKAGDFAPDTHFTFYFPKQNVALADFLEKSGARVNTDEYGLLLVRGNERNICDSDRISPIKPTEFAGFERLHDSIFPELYITGKGITDSIGKNREVFVMTEDGGISAYSVLERTSDPSLAVAGIIGVKEGMRHRGRGRAVLGHLIKAAFSDDRVNRLRLIVDCDNFNALKLYFDLGFEIEFENRCYTIE